MNRGTALIEAMKGAGLDVLTAVYSTDGVAAMVGGDCGAWDRFRQPQGFTTEQARAADRLADVVASVTFLGNGPDGAIIARGDLTRLAAALDEYRNAKRDGGPHAQ